jgi:putative transposase
LLRAAIAEVRRQRHFSIIAIVLLPDHLHAVWQLPPNDLDYSARWRHIKTLFTRGWVLQNAETGTRSLSRRLRGEQGVWQRRFFEHTCRDDADLERCVDYVHINPLKHQLVDRVVNWPWSSFHRYVRTGHYSPEWGSANVWCGDEFRRFE